MTCVGDLVCDGCSYVGNNYPIIFTNSFTITVIVNITITVTIIISIIIILFIIVNVVDIVIAAVVTSAKDVMFLVALVS